MEGEEVVGFGQVGLRSWKNGFRSETWNTGWMARRGGSLGDRRRCRCVR